MPDQLLALVLGTAVLATKAGPALAQPSAPTSSRSRTDAHHWHQLGRHQARPRTRRNDPFPGAKEQRS